jgi:hypothetical protein
VYLSDTPPLRYISYGDIYENDVVVAVLLKTKGTKKKERKLTKTMTLF